jgi:hypothetical protein
MQQELLTLTAAAGKQEPEITSLKLELEAKDHGVPIGHCEVAVLEKTPSELSNAEDLRMELRVKEVKDRLEKLKWRSTSSTTQESSNADPVSMPTSTLDDRSKVSPATRSTKKPPKAVTMLRISYHVGRLIPR